MTQPGAGSTVTREVVLPTPDGVIRGAVAVTSGPMTLAGLVPTAQQLANALVARANKLEVLQGREISCCAGCAACCRQLVPVSPPEALYLLDVLDRLASGHRDAVAARFDAVEARVASAGLLEEVLSPRIDDPEAAVLPAAQAYFALAEPCPFLVDESCSIHAHRPTACRDYNVTSPAAWCATPYAHDIAKVPMPLPLSVPLANTVARVLQRGAQLIPLSMVARWGRENGALRGRTFAGPELFDAFLAELQAVYGSEGGEGP